MSAVLSYKKFREKAAESNLTQKELGKVLGISDRYVRILATEDRNVSIALFERICRLFQTAWVDMLVYVKDITV